MLEFTSLPPAWGLPSSCPKCIETELYLQMGSIPASTIHSSYPYSSLTLAPLPALRYGKKYAKADDCLNFLKAHFLDIDRTSNLSQTQRADIAAYSSLVHDTLYPAMQYLLWNYNYPAISRVYCSAGFPLSVILPSQQSRAVASESQNRRVASLEEVLARIRSTLLILSNRLDSHQFFFLDLTSLDAVVAAHIAVLYHVPWIMGSVKELIDDEFPNLRRHFQTTLTLFIADFVSGAPLAISREELIRIRQSRPSTVAVFHELPVVEVEKTKRKLTQDEIARRLFLRRVGHAFLAAIVGVTIWANLRPQDSGSSSGDAPASS